MRSNGISVISNRRHISLPVEDILYIQLAGRRAVIHASGGRTYETYTTIEELEQMLGSGFIRTDRATLVAAKGIHAIGRQIELINGETLDYAHRRKQQLKEQLRADWRQIAQSLSNSDAPATREDYQRHYASYDSAPFAFTDIEMVFNEKRAAVDWIFRYANEALARLEKKAAGAAHRPLLQQHFSQYGRQVAAGLRAHSAVRRNAGDHRSQPGDRHGSEDHLLPHLQGTLRLHPLQAGGNSNDAC